MSGATPMLGYLTAYSLRSALVLCLEEKLLTLILRVMSGRLWRVCLQPLEGMKWITNVYPLNIPVGWTGMCAEGAAFELEACLSSDTLVQLLTIAKSRKTVKGRGLGECVIYVAVRRGPDEVTRCHEWMVMPSRYLRGRPPEECEWAR